MNADPWQLFEQSIDAESTSEAVLLLQEALDVLSSTSALLVDLLEIKAIIISEMARIGAKEIDEAEDAVAEATAGGRAAWTNYYLAEAAFAHRLDELVISSMGQVPEGYFEGEGLKWREARRVELRAASEFRLGRAEVKESVGQLAAMYSGPRRDDGLITPWRLTFELLADPDRGRDLLAVFTDSIVLEEWYRPDYVEKIHAVLSSR